MLLALLISTSKNEPPMKNASRNLVPKNITRNDAVSRNWHFRDTNGTGINGIRDILAKN